MKFIAIGDSVTEGVGDEIDGITLRSWVDHLAHMYNPPFEVHNLAKRGLMTEDIVKLQLDKAVRLKPDIVSVIAGANDVIKGHWNAERYVQSMTTIALALRHLHVPVIISNLPDFTVRLPLSEKLREKIHSQLKEANVIIESLAEQHGLLLVDFWNNAIVTDDSFWSRDFVHPNSRGYLEIAKLVYEKLNSACGIFTYYEL